MTSAAIVMVFVFSIFATLSLIMMKQFGVGLATAVLIDATIVRGVLLPATMKLLGEWNWYLPRWLGWLPTVKLEPGAPQPRAGGAVSDDAARVAPFVSRDVSRGCSSMSRSWAQGSSAFVLLVAGWSVTLVFAITPLVVPLLIGLRSASACSRGRRRAWRESCSASRCDPPPSRPRGRLLDSRLNVLRATDVLEAAGAPPAGVPDRARPARGSLGWGLELLDLPIWYRWVDSGATSSGSSTSTRSPRRCRSPQSGSASSSRPRTCSGCTPALAPAGRGPALRRSWAEATPAEEPRARRLRALTIRSGRDHGRRDAHRDLGADVGRLLLADLALLALSLVVGVPGWIVAVLENPRSPARARQSRRWRSRSASPAVLFGFLVAVWAITTGGYFWPIWPALGLALARGRARRRRLLAAARTGSSGSRRAAPAAVDVQESELRGSSATCTTAPRPGSSRSA